MNRPSHSTGVAFVLSLSLLVACANANHVASATPVAGSADSLQPQILSASSGKKGVLTLSFSVPERSYVTIVHLYTQLSADVLATTAAGAPTAEDALESGAHKIAFVSVPGYVRANAQRAGRIETNPFGASAVTDSPYPAHSFAVVVTTTHPLSLADQQESLADIDLRGPDDEVIQRVATAIGSRSQGAWGASAARSWDAKAPF